MVEVPLTRGKVAIIDDEDAGRVLAYDWVAHRNRTTAKWYARRFEQDNGVRRCILLHRFLLNAPEGVQVDHVNGNGLDDRKSNLRLATGSQNQFNRSRQRNNTTGYKGVYLRKGRQTYAVECRAKGYRVRLSGYKTAIEAARVYDDLARTYHGEFARLNFPEESEQAA